MIIKYPVLFQSFVECVAQLDEEEIDVAVFYGLEEEYEEEEDEQMIVDTEIVCVEVKTGLQV